MKNKTVTLAIAAIPAFFSPFVGSSVSVALPSIGEEFNVNTILLGWVVTSYLLAAGVLSIPFGRVADMLGVKKLFMFSLFTYSLGFFLATVSPTAEFLIFSRIVQGIGAAMDYATRVAILTFVFPASERGKAIGINTGFTYAGLSLGPFIGGFLTQSFGWRTIFLVNIPSGFFALILAVLKLKIGLISDKNEKFDFTGSIIYGFTLLLTIYGLSENIPSLLFTGLIFLLVFTVYENKIKHPVFQVKLLKQNLTFSFSNLAALLNYTSTFATGFILSLYLQYLKNLTPQETGLILLTQPVTMAAAAPLAGWLSDKIEPRTVASTGMAVAATSLYTLSKLNIETPLTNLILSLTFLGLGLGLFSPSNTNAIMGSVEKSFLGVASATVSTMRLIGQLLSMALTMSIISFFNNAATNPLNHFTFTEAANTTFKVFTIICFAGVFVSLARGKVKK